MNKKLKEIIKLNPENKFINYIVKRVQTNNYRGTHISQHNRYDIEYIEIVLSSIHQIVGTKIFKIPPGDYKKDEGALLINKYSEYKTIVDTINGNAARGTYNSIKKNFFVDLDRMGFLTRRNKNEQPVDHGRGIGVYYGQITNDAVKFINSKTLLEKYRFFTDAVEKLFGYKLSDIVETLYYSDYRNTTISIYEFVFILLDDSLSRDEKIELLQSYRSLAKNQRERFIDLMKQYADPKNFKGNKTAKRDFHNWKNEAQQIFTLLKTTVYFDVAPNKFLQLNVGSTGIFSDYLIKRSLTAKTEYFDIHKIGKLPNFELHHIIPFRYVRNKNEFKLIDDYKNLIYLHKNKHKEITRNNDKNVILCADSLKIELKDFNNNSVFANNNTEAKYAKEKINIMNSYNEKLLTAIFEFKK